VLRLVSAVFVVLSVLSAFGPAAPASPPDEPRKITIAVMGDSIADGIWGGLVRMLVRDRRYVLLREAKNSSGFTTSDWLQPLDAVIGKKPDAIVMLLGTNDRQSLVVRDKPRSLFRSKGWEEGYLKRIDDFMDKAGAANIPLVWVGLPIMRDDKWNEESRYLNGLFKTEAEERNVLFLPTWDMTADKDGHYQPYGPDLNGDKRLLRANDGIHFTESGYELIADAVLRTLRQKYPTVFTAMPNKDEQPAPARNEVSNADRASAATKPAAAPGNPASKQPADAGKPESSLADTDKATPAIDRPKPGLDTEQAK
jgi:lysophospholipase L1-like esterase